MIKLSTAFPGQVDNSDPAGYPDGKPRNDIEEDDGTGTPLDELWVSDWEGFKQALLQAAGIEASGTPDKVGASQGLAALDSRFQGHACTFGVSAGGAPELAQSLSPGTDYGLLVINVAHQKTGYEYTVESNQVLVPEPGLYLFTANLTLKAEFSYNNMIMSLRSGSEQVDQLVRTNYEALEDIWIDTSFSKTIWITDPATQKIHLESQSTSTSVRQSSEFTLTRVG